MNSARRCSSSGAISTRLDLTLIYIAACSNNLTGIETVVLHGRGAKIDLRVANAPSRHNRPIPFELTSALLHECLELRSCIT